MTFVLNLGLKTPRISTSLLKTDTIYLQISIVQYISVYFSTVVHCSSVTSIQELTPITDKVSIGNIYPNPAKNNLSIRLKDKSQVKDVYFIDFNGNILIPRRINKTQEGLDINVSNLPEGIYILDLVTDKEVNKIKIIIEK